MKKIIFLIILLRLMSLKASESNKPFLQEASENFLLGILKADYRENPVNELLALKRIPLPHPNLGKVQHPCLLFNSGNKHKILSRKHQQPYQEWANDLIYSTTSNLADPTSLNLTEKKRSKIAKLNAFSYFLTGNNTFKVEAQKALANIAPTLPQQTPEGGEMGYGWEDWMNAATALKQYAVAYDLLYHELNLEERDFIISRLADQTNQMYRNMTRLPKSFEKIEISTGLGIPKNNHIIDISTAVITVAMILDHPRAQDWLDRGLDELEGGLALINSDGSYREGYYYGEFIASRIYQLAVYFKNKFGENLLEIPHLDRFTRWLIDLEKPDGSSPLFDDAFNKHYLYQPLGVGLSPQSKELQYLFEHNLDKHRYSNPLFVESFTAYNSKIRAIQPNYKPLIIYPKGGNVILRNSHLIYGSVLAEPGRPFTTKHDHIEPGAFTLNAFGKNFLIDAGYGSKGVNDINRSWFTSSRAHNIPLVNGLGPDQNPVWGDDLGSEFSNEFGYNEIATVKVKSAYREAQIERTLLFAQQSYFVILDSLASDEEKWFTIPWHGRGQLNHTGINSYTWQQGETSLQAEFLGLENLRVNQAMKLDSYDISQPNNSLAVHLPQNSSTELLSLFIPKSDHLPKITAINLPIITEGSAIAKRLEAAGWEDILVLADSPWETDRLKSNASFALYHNGQTKYIYLKSASSCYIDDELIFSSENKINLLLYLEPTGWSGLIDLPKTAQDLAYPIKLYPQLNPGNLLIDDVIADYIWDDGINFFLTEDAVFSSGKNTSDQILNNGSRENISILQELQYSADPEQELELMSEGDRTHLRNEILDILARTGVEELNQLIGKNRFLQHLYGIALGISTSMWDAEESVAFNLPQSFQIEREILGEKISYREQGKISDKGITPNYQELIIKGKLRMQLINDLKKQHELDLELKYKDYLFYSNWNHYKKLNSYDFELRRNQNCSNWFSKLNFNEFDQQNNQQAGFSRNNYFARLAHYQPWSSNDYNKWFLNGGISSKKLQNRFGVEILNIDNESSKFSDLVKMANYNQSYKLSAKIILGSEVNYENYNAGTGLNFNQSITHTTENNLFRSRLRHYSTQNDKAWKLILEERFFWYSWKISWIADLQEKSYSKLGIEKHGTFFGMGNWVDSRGVLSNNIRYNFADNLSFNASQTLDILNEQLKQVSAGFYFFDNWQLGNEFSLNREDQNWLIGYLGIVGFPVTANDGFKVSCQTCYWENGKLDSYMIRLEQYGRNISPGIFISRDDREFLRCEGYITWHF